jgi:uncharacterized protein YjbI with pentapeptide repeats
MSALRRLGPMVDDKQLKTLLQGATIWNKWRDEHPEDKIELSRADLCDVNLGGANLRNAILRGANLRHSNLYRADLREADLVEADLYRAVLREANLSKAFLNRAALFEANLFRANLREAYLITAGLSKADLSWADLSGAFLVDANLSGVDLRKTCIKGAILTGANLSGSELSGMDLSEVSLHSANLSGSNLSETDLSWADLTEAVLVETNLEKAKLEGCAVYGVSAWNLKLDGADQNNLIITPEDEPIIFVDNIEIAQFIYLLLKHKMIREVIRSIAERGVLILGRFGNGGLDVLQSVAAKLRDLKYLPIIFDFDRPKDKNYTETIKTLIGLSRFVIADLSGPSVAHELASTVPFFKIPFILIIEESRKPYSLHRDILDYPWVLKPVIKFKNKEQLIELIPSKIIEPAEERCKERQKELDRLFNS